MSDDHQPDPGERRFEHGAAKFAPASIWPSALPAVVVLLMASAGLAFGLGPGWRYITDGVTAVAVILMLWEALRQRQRTAAQTAEQIGELLKLLRSAKADFSNAELKTIEAELQRLQLDLLSRATLRR